MPHPDACPDCCCIRRHAYWCPTQAGQLRSTHWLAIDPEDAPELWERESVDHNGELEAAFRAVLAGEQL